MKGEHLYEKIEAYLKDNLAADTRKAFEEELANDAALQKEVDLHRRLQNELTKPNKKLLRDNLKLISVKQIISLDGVAGAPAQENSDPSRSASFNKWWPLLLVALACLIGAYFFSQSDKDTPAPIQETIETPQEQNTIEQPVGNNKKQLHQAANEKTVEPKRNEKPLIASIDPADFTANPYLDNQINNTVRGETYIVLMDESATAEKITLNNGVAQLRLKGSLETDGKIAPDASFVLMIYTNKKEDYLDDRSILNVPINLQSLKNDAFPFQFNANLRITPGLYYYIIAEKSNDDPLFVGKFEVQPTEK